MRILAITSQYPRPGAETAAAFNRQQFAALAKEHDVRVIAPVAWTERLRAKLHGRPGWSEPAGPNALPVDRPTYYFPPRLLEHRWGQCYYRSIRRTVLQRIDEFRPDAILGCWAHPDGWAAVHLARQAGLPVVIKVIGSDVLVLAKNPRRRARIAEALREADSVVAVSRDLAEHVAALGVDQRRIHVVPEGVDESLFHPGDQREARLQLGIDPDERVLLFVGNLLLSKGAGLLVEACRLLQERGVRFRCYLVGQGKHEREVRSALASGGLEERVFLMGARSQRELPAWYRASDVVVLPSFSEGVPNVLREALACGRPFVATRVGGVPEVAPPAFSRLVAPGEPAPLADALEDFLANPPPVNEMIVRRLNPSWEQSARLLAERLQEVLHGRAYGRETEAACAGAMVR
jgi:glycosyltransferase involved in cell wall biosynthesis